MKHKNIHFIAIGGSVMANLAVALKNEGYGITGSDDQIYDPTAAKLKANGLFPERLGWFPEKLKKVDAVIVGMHAKKDNPELVEAQARTLPMYSFPDYILSRSQHKQRIVISGSHGKTTITALIMHVLMFCKKKFDYVIGAGVEGIENTVKLSDAPIIILEGDEYPASPLDQTPKCLKYQHHTGVISGIAWDHANIFTSKKKYTEVFEQFAEATPKGGVLVYNAQEPTVKAIGKKDRQDVNSIPYTTYKHIIHNHTVYIITEKNKKIPIQLFGEHNIQNIAAAEKVMQRIGISCEQFYKALPHFKGASGRLSIIFQNDSMVIFRDFAHAPSKVRASIKAVKERYPARRLIGCLELHTLSSLNKNFLPEYHGSMDACNEIILYYNAAKMQASNTPLLKEDDLYRAFGNQKIRIFTNSQTLANHLSSLHGTCKNLLMMSSGNFDGLELNFLINKISGQ